MRPKGIPGKDIIAISHFPLSIGNGQERFPMDRSCLGLPLAGYLLENVSKILKNTSQVLRYSCRDEAYYLTSDGV
jgi:hypothetical protein